MTTQSETRNLVLTSTQAIRWGDMDALGHVNNTLYFRYMEQARVEWLEKWKIYESTLSSQKKEGFVIINAQCDFLLQLSYPGLIEIKMLLGTVGNSSIMSYYEIRKQGEEALYAQGHSKMVWANYELGKSAPLPDFLRKLLP